MLFNSTLFFIFFAVFFAAYWALRARLGAQNILILGGSYFFYGWWDERFLILIALSTACDYICGIGASGARLRSVDRAKATGLLLGVSILATAASVHESWAYFLYVVGGVLLAGAALRFIDRLQDEMRRRAYLIGSITVNLGLLATFKYFGFFTDSLAVAAHAVGFEVNAFTTKIILPIGISFYTFQTLSYTIDIWRGKMRPTTKLIDFAAYVSFFPQLVAGPIERARRLLPQFEKYRQWDDSSIASGGLLFLWGLYKKAVIADNLAPIVNAAFAAPSETDPALMLIGVLAFSFQIYCDFSGYSDMARGLARMLGFELMLNFNLPYFSRTPSEFWRRWHISLSTWLRDYLYIPLGGNRGGRAMTYRNLFLTMLLGGLWHGAAWTFVLWGAFHGAILSVYRFLKIDDLLAKSRGWVANAALNASAWFLMTVLSLIGWTLFRAETAPAAFSALTRIGGGIFNGQVFSTILRHPEWSLFASLVWPLLASQIFNRFFRDRAVASAQAVMRPGFLTIFARVNAFLFLAVVILTLGAEGQQQFIYFDF